jgi:hypothetical protein
MGRLAGDRGGIRLKAAGWAGFLAYLALLPSLAVADSVGWELEQGVQEPSYAVTSPARTDLNIDSVALVCEQAGEARGLQLQLHLTDNGPLAPAGVPPSALKDAARAEIDIDGRTFRTGIFFADAHVVLADDTRERVPVLSTRLLDAMERGRMMVLRFDLVAERAGEPASFDSEAVVDLQAGAGRAAIAALRRCIEPAGPRVAAKTVSN